MSIVRYLIQRREAAALLEQERLSERLASLALKSTQSSPTARTKPLEVNMAIDQRTADIEEYTEYLKNHGALTFKDFRDVIGRELSARGKHVTIGYCDGIASRAWSRVHAGGTPASDNGELPRDSVGYPVGSPQWYIDAFEKITANMLAITRAKNSDYTGGSDDAFQNFRLVESMNIASVEVGILTRMSDKFARIAGLTKPGAEAKVKSESLADTLLDLANYSIILLLYLRAKRMQSAVQITTDRAGKNAEPYVDPFGHG